MDAALIVRLLARGGPADRDDLVLTAPEQKKEGVHTSDGDNAIYFRPETGNSILIGSEDPECDPKEWIPNPDEFNREITDSQWKAQVYRCMRRIPNLEEPSRKRGVVDLYDVSDDWLPIYDSTRIKGYYMAIGSSGNQFKNAPIAGHCMAELIEACEKGQHYVCPEEGRHDFVNDAVHPQVIGPLEVVLPGGCTLST